MKKTFIALFFLISHTGFAHVPVLLLPLKGTPVSSYFIGQSEISRAIYSELTNPEDYLVMQFKVGAEEPLFVQILTPACTSIPHYEDYQPSALLVRGDLPWKNQGETNRQYLYRLEGIAVAKILSRYEKGGRPQFYEPFGKQTYWVGGEWRGNLDPGLYALIVFNTDANKGNFCIGLNEKEAWTPDLYRYAGEVSATVHSRICNPRGFTGELRF